MVSYKKLYLAKCEELNKLLNVGEKLNYACPECRSQLEWIGTELVCSRKECSFDKTPSNWFSLLIDHYGLEEYKSQIDA